MNFLFITPDIGNQLFQYKAKRNLQKKHTHKILKVYRMSIDVSYDSLYTQKIFSALPNRKTLTQILQHKKKIKLPTLPTANEIKKS